MPDPISTGRLIVELAKLGVELFQVIRGATEGDPGKVAHVRALGMAAGYAAHRAAKFAGRRAKQ